MPGNVRRRPATGEMDEDHVCCEQAFCPDVLRGAKRALPGAVHDKKAERIWGVLAELEAAGLVTLADKGYRGSNHAKIPYLGKNKPQSQKEDNRAHARPRAPGERANAQLKTAQDVENSP